MIANERSSTFRYSALTLGGDGRRGSIVAATETAARVMLANQELFIIELRTSDTGRRRRTNISASDVALGFRILANLVDAGLPIDQAIDAFDELCPPTWKRSVSYIEQCVSEGQSLSMSLSSCLSLNIPDTAIGLVSGGELGAGLGAGLKAAADWAESRAANRAAIASALAYPCVVALVGIVAITILITTVVPRFSRLIADLGQSPPPLMQALVQISNIITTVALPGLMALVCVALAIAAATDPRERNQRLHAMMLRIPVLGEIAMATASSRVLFSLASLVGSGVTIPAAIAIAASAAGNKEVEIRLQTAADLIVAGESFAKALSTAHAVSVISLRLVASGERSGRLVQMLSHAATLERSRAENRTKQLTRALEPVLLLFVAAFVGVIAASILQAVYSIKPRI